MGWGLLASNLCAAVLGSAGRGFKENSRRNVKRNLNGLGQLKVVGPMICFLGHTPRGGASSPLESWIDDVEAGARMWQICVRFLNSADYVRENRPRIYVARP